MTKPLSPIVAMNANASVTPPNWASTPDADGDDAGARAPSGRAVTTA